MEYEFVAYTTRLITSPNIQKPSRRRLPCICTTANPDGQMLVTGQWASLQAGDVRSAAGGRFNQNGVDLNRNWDCAWAGRGPGGVAYGLAAA